MSRACPNCQYPLEVVVYKMVQADHCRRCGGTFLDPGEETEMLGMFTSPELWKDARITTELGPSWHQCPDHHLPLTAYSVRFGKKEVEVDLCPECRGMWLDASEGMRLRNIVMSAGQSGETEMASRPGIPSYLFQVISGFPREVWNPMRRSPRMTLGIIASLYLVFAIQMLLVFLGDVENYQWLISTFAMKPDNVLAGTHLWTPLTSAFLHCGFAHILGNTYFLYIFGDNVEDFLGSGVFLGLYLLAALSGSVAQVLWQSDGTIPSMGASGAVAGLMGAYLMLFPRVKVFMVLFLIRFRLGITIYLGLWLLFNLVMAFLGEQYSVAWMDHVGGFLAGAAVAWYFRPRNLRARFA